jgi:RNAse (barnase) inhibitor barstar
MAIVEFHGATLRDIASFHSICCHIFGFPDFYGMNMNAWIDCLTYLDDDDGMSNVVLPPGEHLTIVLHDSDLVRKNAPDVLDALIVGCTAVNQRQRDMQKASRLVIVFL